MIGIGGVQKDDNMYSPLNVGLDENPNSSTFYLGNGVTT